jgi:hypothetical protein
VTIPAHDPLTVTVAAVLADVGAHLKTDCDELMRRLFGS